jgi:hypothetical protein
MSHSLRVVLAISVAALVSLGLAGRAAASTPACGSVLTASVTFTSDLSCPGPVALYVGANVTVDLNGYTLSGPSSGSFSAGVKDVSPFVGAVGPAVVKNGTITGFSTAVWDIQGGPITISHMWLVRNGSAFDAMLTGANLWTFEYSTIAFNGTGLSLGEQARTGVVRSNRIVFNGGDGVSSTYAADNVLYDSNEISWNAGYGINLRSSTSRIIHNDVVGNGNTGIRVVDPDAPALFFPYVLAGNNASHNHGHGIDVSDPRWDGGGNIASGNVLDPQCINIVCL